MNTAISMVQEYKPRAYAALSKILYLPNERYLRSVLKQSIGNNNDGPQTETMDGQNLIWSKWAEENPSKSEGWNDVSVSYDSLKVAPGMLLMRRKDQKNRLQGAILPESMDIATKLFDQFVYKITGERGLNPADREESQMESVADMLVLNSEHSVYYVTSINPHCGMCFIAGMYNNPTLTSDKITMQIDEVSRALARKGFFKRAEVSDYAGCNQGSQMSGMMFQQQSIFLREF